MRKSITLFTIILNLYSAQSQNVLCGRVIDEETKSPVDAIVFLSNSKDHIEVDSLGSFCIELDSTQVVYFLSPTYSLYKLNVHEPYATVEMGKAIKGNSENNHSNTYNYEADRKSPITGFSPSFSISVLETD